MGLNTETFHLLDKNKEIFYNKKILTIGKQTNYIDHKLLEKIGIEKNEYTDNIWKQRWKVDTIDSIDYSNYELPTHIRDFNLPIEKEFYSNYDVVFDGGSSEHIFNIMQVFNNYNDILKTGGYYIGVLPMNNHVNHGFYQFSPDFFYSLFSKERGYETSCYIYDKDRYKIKDLREFKKVYHANLNISSYPNLIYIIAKKIEEKDFSSYPQQTVYNEHLWKTDSSNISIQQQDKISVFKKIYRFISPERLKIKVQDYLTRREMLEKNNN